jgi:arylsulfatase A-like enzyme
LELRRVAMPENRTLSRIGCFVQSLSLHRHVFANSGGSPDGTNHTCGNGQIAAIANDFDGFSGVIPKTSAAMAEVLKAYGCNTSASGTWHDTPEEQISNKGPFDCWPTGYGFEYFYGFLAGEASQDEPTMVRNTSYVDRPKTSGGNDHYHLSEDIADDAIGWLRDQKAYSPDKPFFRYWAPGASHGSHQVRKEWADNAAGRQDWRSAGHHVEREWRRSWPGMRPARHVTSLLQQRDD